ncbi:MAG TPA: Holliday junction branch migration protein RuvA [Dehalococcoidia bacterium]|nr:Holliday junction branch migration protein RuvA [Dehalococcoidia bacterium]
MSAVGRIWGVVEDSGPEGITVRVDGTGLGLLVQVPGHTRDDIGVPGREVSLYTYLQARENDVALYGFATADELRLFHLLIGVSGVGPKAALALLTGLPGDSIWEAIAGGDVERIRGVPGIGAKTASRIIIDLKGRLPEHVSAGVPVASLLSADEEVIAALVSLGYTQAEASAAASRLPSDGTLSLEDKIRLALSSFTG